VIRAVVLSRTVLGLLCLPVGGCKPTPAARRFSFDGDAGVLLRKNGQTCAAFPDSTLAAQPIQFVTASMPQTIGRAQLTAKSVACKTLFSDTSTVASTYYDAQIVGGTLDEGLPAMAVAVVTAPLTMKDSTVTADLDGDGKADVFRSCTSADGAHLTLWDGVPPNGRREWHRYVYLGYDLEATCSDAETKP
jgi:hypothetical protein